MQVVEKSLIDCIEGIRCRVGTALSTSNHADIDER